MNKDTHSIKLEIIYQYLWAAHDEAPFSLLDRSLNPRSSTALMLDLIRQVGIDEDSVVLDAGCGRGNHTITLSERFRCNLTGLDLLASNLEMAKKAAVEARLSSRINFTHGSIESIPSVNDAFDYIWCRDVLIHVVDLKQAIRECFRVLQPDGAMLVYTTFRTEWLEPKEMARVCDPLGIVMRNLSMEYFEQIISDAGFDIVIREVLRSEQIEYLEERDRRYSKELMRITRMLRHRERFLKELGEVRYQIALALYHWGIYQLLGKLSSTIYVLKKAYEED